MAKRKRDDGDLVYSSGPDGSRAYGAGGKVVETKGIAASLDIPPAQHKVRVTVDTKAARGKTLTIVSGLILTAPTLDKLAKQLKQTCGAGGTVKGATIEIQGEHRERVVQLLTKLGYGLA